VDVATVVKRHTERRNERDRTIVIRERLLVLFQKLMRSSAVKQGGEVRRVLENCLRVRFDRAPVVMPVEPIVALPVLRFAEAGDRHQQARQNENTCVRASSSLPCPQWQRIMPRKRCDPLQDLLSPPLSVLSTINWPRGQLPCTRRGLRGAEGGPAVRRAATLALQSLDAESLG
jgi:hypothetical protein